MARAHTKPGVVRDDRRAVVLAEQQLETVSETEPLDIQCWTKGDGLQMGDLPVRRRGRVQFREVLCAQFRARATHQYPSSVAMEPDYRKSVAAARPDASAISELDQ